MRPLQRLNFVLRQEAQHAVDDDQDVGFASVEPQGGGASITPLTPVKAEPPRRAHPLATSRGFGQKRRWLVTGEPREDSAEEAREPGRAERDAETAERLVNLVRELNQAMDDALAQGLIVEPALSRVKGRYGASEESGAFVLSLKLFRKLC